MGKPLSESQRRRLEQSAKDRALHSAENTAAVQGQKSSSPHNQIPRTSKDWIVLFWKIACKEWLIIAGSILLYISWVIQTKFVEDSRDEFEVRIITFRDVQHSEINKNLTFMHSEMINKLFPKTDSSFLELRSELLFAEINYSLGLLKTSTFISLDNLSDRDSLQLLQDDLAKRFSDLKTARDAKDTTALKNMLFSLNGEMEVLGLDRKNKVNQLINKARSDSNYWNTWFWITGLLGPLLLGIQFMKKKMNFQGSDS